MSKEIIGGALLVNGGPVVPASKAVRAGDYLYVSGQLALGKDGRFQSGTVEEETDLVFTNIAYILRMANLSLGDIVKCTCWITSESDFEGFNKIYSKFFPADPPARTTIIAKLMFGAKVEVEAIAYRDTL